MYNFLISQIPSSNIQNLEFSIHTAITNLNCEMLQAENEVDQSVIYASCPVRMWALIDQQPTLVGLRPSPEPHTTDKRYPYDEELIAKECVITQDTAYLPNSSSYSFIESLVAGNKAFLTHAENPSVMRKRWVFTGLSLPYTVSSWEHLTLELTSKLGGKFFKSSFCVDHRCRGSIHFSLVPA